MIKVTYPLAKQPTPPDFVAQGTYEDPSDLGACLVHRRVGTVKVYLGTKLYVANTFWSFTFTKIPAGKYTLIVQDTVTKAEKRLKIVVKRKAAIRKKARAHKGTLSGPWPMPTPIFPTPNPPPNPTWPTSFIAFGYATIPDQSLPDPTVRGAMVSGRGLPTTIPGTPCGDPPTQQNDYFYQLQFNIPATGNPYRLSVASNRHNPPAQVNDIYVG